MTSPHEGAIGAVIQYTVLDENGVALDISAATVKQLVFKKPDKSVVTKDAEFVTDGSDGKLSYTSIADDLTPYGTFEVQAKIVTPLINDRTEVRVFDVWRAL